MLEEEISAEAVEVAPVGSGEPGAELEDPALYFNRELSWLDFNERVLELAEDATVPLLERVKFCASTPPTSTSSSWSGSPGCSTRSTPASTPAAPTGSRPGSRSTRSIPQLFETLEQGLRALVTSQTPALTALLFQIRLLGLIGFRPQTDHCAACGKSRLMGEPQFSPLSGGLVCVVCAARQVFRCLPLSRGSLAFLQQALRLSPAVVNRLKAAGQVRHEVENVIEGYVTVVAGRQLPPVNFLSRVRREDGTARREGSRFQTLQPSA